MAAALLLVLTSSRALLAPSFSARPVRLTAASLRLPALHLSALGDVPPDQGVAVPSQVENLKANAKGLFYTAYPKGGRAFVSNVLSGFTVSLAMIPEAVAFAFVAGVSPIVGLWTTVVMGFFAAAFGAGRGSMTGASGACAVVMTSLVAAHGPAYLSAAALLAGLYQIACGALGLGKFIRLVPHPVMLGFVNGLAIVMTRAQLTHFRDPLTGGLLRGARGLTMAALTVATMALVKLIPKLTTALPPSLLAVGIVTAATRLLRLPATTLVDIAGAETFAGGVSVLPKLGIPAMGALTADPLRFLGIIAPYAVTMGTVGLLESLLTVQLLDGLVDDGRRASTRKECVGQGLGNVAAGLTSGMGGCALIGQSLINVQSGAPATRLQAHATPRSRLHLAAPRCISATSPRPTSPHGRRHLAAVGRRDVALPRRWHLRRRACPRPGARGVSRGRDAPRVLLHFLVVVTPPHAGAHPAHRRGRHRAGLRRDCLPGPRQGRGGRHSCLGALLRMEAIDAHLRKGGQGAAGSHGVRRRAAGGVEDLPDPGAALLRLDPGFRRPLRPQGRPRQRGARLHGEPRV